MTSFLSGLTLGLVAGFIILSVVVSHIQAYWTKRIEKHLDQVDQSLYNVEQRLFAPEKPRIRRTKTSIDPTG